MAVRSRSLIGCTLCLLASVASCTSSVAPRSAVAPAPPTQSVATSSIVDDDDEASPSPIAATLDDLLVVAVRRHTRRQATATAELAYPIVIAYWELAYADAEADVRAAARETARSASRPGDDVRHEIAELEASLLEAQANVERASRVLHEQVVTTAKPALLRAADPLAITDDEIPPGAFAAERQRVAHAAEAVERAEHAVDAGVRSSAEMLQLQSAVTSARVVRARAMADLREAIATDELAGGTLLAHHRIALR